MRLIDADALYENISKEIETYYNSVNGGYYLAEDTLKEIENAPTIEPKRNKWIPCEERPPENGKAYLVFQEYDGYFWNQVLEYNDGWNCTKDSKEFEIDYVVAWMPLPEPYNGARITERSK